MFVKEWEVPNLLDNGLGISKTKGNLAKQVSIVGSSINNYEGILYRSLRNYLHIGFIYAWFTFFTLYELYWVFFDTSICNLLWGLHMCALAFWLYELPKFHYEMKYYLYEYSIYLERKKE